MCIPVGTDSRISLGAKYHLYSNEPHEFMLSVGVNVEIGGTGAARVGAENFSTITPAVFFGKGFGARKFNMAKASRDHR